MSFATVHIVDTNSRLVIRVNKFECCSCGRYGYIYQFSTTYPELGCREVTITEKLSHVAPLRNSVHNRINDKVHP